MKRVTIEDAPAVLSMNDRAMWVLGYNELVEKLEGHAIALGRTGPLGRAISVLQDVLTDIEDWEDKALAEAVTDARKGLLMMLEVEKLKRAANPVPRVIASGVATVAQAQPLYRFLTEADTIEASDEFVDDDCVRWNPPDRWSIGRPYHSAFKTARRKLAAGVMGIDVETFCTNTPTGERAKD